MNNMTLIVCELYDLCFWSPSIARHSLTLQGGKICCLLSSLLKSCQPLVFNDLCSLSLSPSLSLSVSVSPPLSLYISVLLSLSLSLSSLSLSLSLALSVICCTVSSYTRREARPGGYKGENNKQLKDLLRRVGGMGLNKHLFLMHLQ